MDFTAGALLFICAVQLSVAEGTRCERLCSAEHLKDKCERCMSRIPMRFGKRAQMAPPTSAAIPPFRNPGSFSEEMKERQRNDYPAWEDASSNYPVNRHSWDDSEEVRDFDWDEIDARDRNSIPESFSPNPRWVCFRKDTIDEIEVFRSNGIFGSSNDDNKRTSTWL